MYICVCKRVTDHQIRDAAGRGVNSIDGLCNELDVATCCGRCRDCARRVLNDALTERWRMDVELATA